MGLYELCGNPYLNQIPDKCYLLNGSLKYSLFGYCKNLNSHKAAHNTCSSECFIKMYFLFSTFTNLSAASGEQKLLVTFGMSNKI